MFALLLHSFFTCVLFVHFLSFSLCFYFSFLVMFTFSFVFRLFFSLFLFSSIFSAALHTEHLLEAATASHSLKEKARCNNCG